MAGCFCKELRLQDGKIVHKRTYYAKVDVAKCCNEAMAHKNNVICQSRVISRAVKLFAGKSQSGRLAQSSSCAGLAIHPQLWPGWQRQLLSVPALAGGCGAGKQAWQTGIKTTGSLRVFGLVLIFKVRFFSKKFLKMLFSPDRYCKSLVILFFSCFTSGKKPFSLVFLSGTETIQPCLPLFW